MTRHLAKAYVGQLLDRGYSGEDAQAEICMGMGGPSEPGYEIRHGKIECPPFSGNRFSFPELAAEVLRGQMELGL